MFSASGPIRQAYINGCISSRQRATVLFDALMGSSGGVVSQPALGRSADVWSSTSYPITGAITAAALPFVALAKREDAASDAITDFEETS